MIKVTVIKLIGKISSQNQCLDNSNVDAIPSVLAILFGGHRWITPTDTIVPPTVYYNSLNNVQLIRSGYTRRLLGASEYLNNQIELIAVYATFNIRFVLGKKSGSRDNGTT